MIDVHHLTIEKSERRELGKEWREWGVGRESVWTLETSIMVWVTYSLDVDRSGYEP